jgi:hypothetical protein
MLTTELETARSVGIVTVPSAVACGRQDHVPQQRDPAAGVEYWWDAVRLGMDDHAALPGSRATRLRAKMHLSGKATIRA